MLHHGQIACVSAAVSFWRREGEDGKKQKQKRALSDSLESEKENTQLDVGEFTRTHQEVQGRKEGRQQGCGLKFSAQQVGSLTGVSKV